MIEPEQKKIICSYCGDAPIPHRLFYFASLISFTIDRHIANVTRHAPDFLKDFVNWFMVFFFQTFLFFKLARLSNDIDKAATFRSRVIWEEARKRGIEMEQVILFGKPIDQYRAKVHGKYIYFNSLPIPPKLLDDRENWDDKFLLKQEFSKRNIPVPHYVQFPIFYPQNLENIFSKFKTAVIVKPRAGSRGRHTVTNIQTIEQFKAGVHTAKEISAYLIAEEYLEGYVCRATFVNGELMGFYRGDAPFVVGDGEKSVYDLIIEKDLHRPERVSKVPLNEEFEKYILRAGFTMTDVLPKGVHLSLTHRTGRLFGGATREMLDELHPSFVPILKQAAGVVELPVIGFDCIIPDPEKSQESQRWGIIECNTLPFIDLHYYALEGRPKNIAGKIWDLWDINEPQ